MPQGAAQGSWDSPVGPAGSALLSTSESRWSAKTPGVATGKQTRDMQVDDNRIGAILDTLSSVHGGQTIRAIGTWLESKSDDVASVMRRG